jgi:ADP-ribose pyrophosphatase YjhB (NUDIX family)
VRGQNGKDEAAAFGHEVLAVALQVQQDRLSVLLWQRAEPPHASRWALPGGRLLAEERMGASVARHLAEKVDVRTVAHLEQLETRSDPHRDPRGRILATAYLGLVPTTAHAAVPPDTRWHPVDELPALAFDHRSIVESGLARLRAKLSYTNIAFALAPPEFTLQQLRRVYVAALGYDLSVTNLKRVLTRRELIEPLDTQAGPGPAGGRPATRYRFCSEAVLVTDAGAVFRSRR